MELKDKKCIPCSTYIPPFSMDEKKHFLTQLGPNWKLIHGDTHLFCEFKFKNFKRALEFLNTMSEIAEEQKHHPEMTLGWGYCRVEIWTHTNNNLIENDFILAAKIEDAFNQTSVPKV